jgi:hypothetical protein
MLRYSLAALAALWAAAPATAATWADRLFDELSKDFGSVPRGPTLQHHFRVANTTGQPVNISNVRVSCGCVTARALKAFLNPGEETAIFATMDTTRFVGARSVTIFVTFDRPSFDEVRLLVQAIGRNDFMVTPDTLAFGAVRRGSTAAREVTVVFYGVGGARVTEVRSESNYILAQIEEARRGEAEAGYKLTAKLRGDLPVGKWYTDVWLRTNLPSMPQVRVPLTVEVEAALTVSPEAVVLGQVHMGDEGERRVIVRGVRPFRITQIEGADAALSVSDSSEEARSVHVLTVRFKPGRAGEVSRTLHVHTDLPADGAFDLPVTAQVMP